jgi:hypothetical protein
LIIDAVVAELQSNGLIASRIVVNPYSTGFADLSAFFEQLAKTGVAGMASAAGRRPRATSRSRHATSTGTYSCA